MKQYTILFTIGYVITLEAMNKRQAISKAKKEYVKNNYDTLEPKENISYIIESEKV